MFPIVESGVKVDKVAVTHLASFVEGSLDTFISPDWYRHPSGITKIMYFFATTFNGVCKDRKNFGLVDVSECFLVMNEL